MRLLVAFCLVLIVGTASAQISTFTSNVASGNWDAPGSWTEVGSDADNIPDADDIVIIQSGHNILLNGAQAASTVTINSGGTLTATIGSLTPGTMTVNGTGTYVHDIDGGTIPNATWSSTSNVFITGVTGTAPTGYGGQTFGNFTWSSSAQNTNIYLAASFTVDGNFEVLDTGLPVNPGSRALRMSPDGTSYSITVNGNFLVDNSTFKMNNNTGSCSLNIPTGNLEVRNNANFTISTGNATSTVNVSGNVSIVSGSTLLMHEDNNPAVSGNLNIGGNLDFTGGLIDETDSGTGNITFNGGTTQTVTSGGGAVTNTINFIVNSGTLLQMAAPGTVIDGDGSFTLANGATLGVTSPDGISTSGATGNIQVTGTRTYTTGASYIYNGTGDQNVGNGLTQNTPANIEFNNPGNVVSLVAATSLTGNMTVTAGTLATNNQVVSGTGTFLLSSGTTLGVTSSDGISTSGATGNIQVSGSRTYSSGANYIYNGTGNQISGNGLTQNTPSNIEINNPGNTVSLSTPPNLTGNLTITSGALDTNGQKVTFSGGGAQTITGFAASQSFDDFEVNKIGGGLTIGGSITTLSLANFILTQGTFTAPATLSTSGGFTLTSGTYTAGTNTNVAGNFTRNGGTFLPGGGTVTFNGAGLQILGGSTGTTFNNVATANSTNTTVTVATTVGSNLIVVDGTTFTISTGNFSVNGSTIIGTGTSGILSVSSGAGSKIFTGLVLINSGGNWNNGSNAPIEFRNGITNSGLFTAGTGLHTFSTNPQGLSGTFSIPNITTDIALTNSNSLTVGAALSGSGSLIQSAGADLDLGGSFSISTINAANAGNTVVYSGNSQSIKAISYENLTINQSSGEAQLAGATTVNDVLDLSARNLNLSGYNLILESTATINVAGPSASKMIVAGGGGEVRKIFTGDGSFTFPIGDNAGMLEYSPVTVNVAGTGYAGGAYIGASVSDAKHANNASATHFISRYWELTQSGITTPTATVTASYLAPDINGVEASIGAAYLDGAFNQVTNPWVKSGEVLGANTLTYTGASLGVGVNTFTGITTASLTVTIDNGATASVCESATITLNTTVVGGDGAIDYSWSPVTDLSSASGSDPIYTGVTPGGPYTYTVTVRDANGITATDNIDITVTAAPTADAGAATAETCEDTSYTVAGASVTNSSGILWTHDGAGTITGGTETTLTPQYNPVAADGGTVVTLTMTVSGNGSCVAAVDTQALTVTSTVIIDAGNDEQICQSSSAQNFVFASRATPASVSNSNGVYSWSAVPPASGTFVNSTDLNPVFNIVAGFAGDITFTLNANSTGSCVPGTDGFTLTVKPTPIVDPIVDIVVCSGATIPVTVFSANTGGGETFNWTNDNVAIGIGASGVGDLPSFMAATNNGVGQTIGNISVTATLNGCVGPARIFRITINPEPVGVPLTATRCSDVVLGTAFTLNTNGTSVSAASYNITAITNGAGLVASAGTPGTGTGFSAGVLIDDAWTNQTGSQQSIIYTIRPVSSNGCSGQPFAVTVTVDPEPATTAPVMTAPVCSDVVTGYVLSVAGASSYIVGINSNGLTQSAGGGTPSVLNDDAWTNVTGGVVNVVYTVTPVAGTCNGDVFTVTVPITPEPLGSNATASLCSGSGTLNYDLQANITANNGLASSFSWLALVDNTNVSNESLSAQTTSFINDPLVNTTGIDQIVTYTVTPTSAGCVGNSFTVAVTVRPEPVGVPVTATRCSDVALGTAFTLKTNGTSVSASSYNITAITNISGLTPGPGVPSVVPGSYAFDELLDDTWTNQTGSQQAIIYTVVPVSSTGCLGQPFNMTVNVDPEPATTSPVVTAAVCSDIATGYVLSVAGASSYVVSINSNGLAQSAGAGTPSVISDDAWTNVTAATVNVVYTVTPVAGSCNGDVFTVTVPISPEPLGSNATASLCSGSGTLNYDLQNNINSNNGLATTFSWLALVDNTNVMGESLVAQTTAFINDPLVNTTGVDQVVTYTVTPTSGGCTGNTFTVVVTVQPEPVGVNDSKSVCSDVAIDYSLLLNVATMGNNVGSTFSWVATDNINPLVTGESLAPVVGPSITDVITNLTNTDQNVVYSVTPTGTNGCLGATFQITITVKPEPVGVSAPAPDICSGTSVAYDLQNNVNTLPGNGLLANFTWTAAPNPNVTGETTSLKSGSIIDDVLVNTTTSDEIVTYTVTPTGQAGGCQGNPFIITVTVNPEAIFSAGVDLSVCVDDASKVLAGSSTFAPGGLMWSGGTGMFSNPTIPNPTYTLSASELAVTSPLNVTLTLTAYGTGACADVIDQMVLTINPQPIVVFSGFPVGAPPQMAENNAPITLTGNQVGGVFTISPATSNIGSTTASPVDKASFDPAAVDLGSNFVTYTYTDPNGCLNTDTQEVIVNPVTNVDFTMQYTIGSAPFPFVPINGLGEFELCGDVGLVKLVGNPAASSGLPPETQFTSIPAYGGGPTAPISFDGTDYYIQTNGLVSDRYRILYTYKNAFNAITTKIRDIKIFASPVVAINVLNSCINSAIDFVDGSSLPATPFPATITGWQWNFADGFFSNQQNPSHNYVASGLYNVALTVSTSQGCTNLDNQSIRVGDVPEVDYSWSAICNNDNTVFADKTSKVVGGTPPGISEIDVYTWDFGDGDILIGDFTLGGNANDPVPPGTHGGRTTGTYKNPEHKYNSFGTYDSQLQVDTDDGCNNSLIQKVFILPFSTVTPLATSAYNEDFELTNGGWIEESTSPSDTSWIWGVPTGTNITTASSGTKAWWTGKNGNTYFPNEKSVVNGPCFNLTQLERPMVSLDYWADMENNVDGTVMQYSTDGGISWNIVGPPVGQVDRDEGINWFNGVTIPSNPGAQPLGSYGWTNKLGGWKNGRFNLDMVPPAERDQVRLRIAFASNDGNPASDTYDGFAFDNVFVGNKMRNVLVEHFTNSALAPSTSGDNYLDNRLIDQFAVRSASDFNDVRYHISFPSPDPLNIENPTDPGARASYYNVSQAPSTIMDGKLDGVKFTGSFLDITNKEIDRRALVDPLFEIVLDTVPTNNSNTITSRLSITATQAFTAPLIAQVVLVEKSVSGAKNVVRKQLFGADGATISTPWALGQNLVQSKTDVVINVPITDGSQLVLVGYIQDKNTKEIYQSMVIDAPVKRGSVVVGLEDEPFDPIPDQITMYPNPSNGEVNFGLPSGNMNGYTWQIADQRGVVMLKGNFETSVNDVMSVTVSDLPNGVYHVIITGRNNSATYKKLVVMNRN